VIIGRWVSEPWSHCEIHVKGVLSPSLPFPSLPSCFPPTPLPPASLTAEQREELISACAFQVMAGWSGVPVPPLHPVPGVRVEEALTCAAYKELLNVHTLPSLQFPFLRPSYAFPPLPIPPPYSRGDNDGQATSCWRGEVVSLWPRMPAAFYPALRVIHRVGRHLCVVLST